MTIQRARLFILLSSLVLLGSAAIAQSPPPGALNPAMGPGQLPPPSPYYGAPPSGPMGPMGAMPPGAAMPTGMMAMGPGTMAIPPGGAMPGMPPGAMPGMPPGAMQGMPPGAMSGMPPGAMPGMPPGAMAGMPPGVMPAGAMSPYQPGMQAMAMGAQAGAMATPGPYGVAPVAACDDCPPLPGTDGTYVCEGCNGYGCPACGGSGRRCDRGLDIFGRLASALKPYGAGGWCAPRWYDVYGEYVHMTRDEGTRGGGLVSDGPAGLNPPLIVLSTDSVDLDAAGGFRTGVAVHVGAYSAVEFHFLGALNWAGSAQVESPLDELYHAFSDFGTNPPPQAGPPIVRGGFTDTDSAELATLEHSSNFDTFELDYRRRWVAPNCRFHGSWLAGVRYAKLDEELVHGMVVDYPDPNGGGGSITGFLDAFTGTSNSMTGAQLGGDMWVTLIPGFRIGSEFKGGIYGNRASQRTVINAGSLGAPVVEEANSDQVSFLLEWGINTTWRLSENWTIRKGYTLIFVDGVALAPENFNTTEPFTAARQPLLVDDGSMFMHGFNIGLEWMW